MPRFLSHTLKKILVALMVLSFVFSPAPLAVASGIPVVDIAHIVETTIGVGQNTITAAETTIDTLQNLYEFDLDFIVEALKIDLVKSLQEKITGFAQGKNSQPKFVENWQLYLRDARSQGAGAFANDIADARLCDTFEDKVLADVGSFGSVGGVSSDTNLDQFECDFAPGELEAFQKDFTKGGWDAYLLTLEPQNNYIGAAMLARRAQAVSANEAQAAAEAEAIAGGGFLSAKTKDSNGVPQITTPGSLIKDITAAAAKADFDLITNAKRITDLAALADSFISELTKNDDDGLANMNINERRRRRNERRNTDGSRVLLSRIEIENLCYEIYPPVYLANGNLDPANDETALRASCIESMSSEKGNREGQKHVLLGQVQQMIKHREAARIAFNDIIPKKRKKINTYDTNDDGVVDDYRLCTADKQGQRTRDGSLTSIDTGKIFVKKDGRWKSRSCVTQDQFDALLPDFNELKALETQNKNALDALRDFRGRLKTASNSDDPAIPNSIAALEIEFATGNDFGSLVCGTQSLAHPEFNEQCTDYTLARAEGEVARLELPVDETESDEGTVETTE